MEIIIITPSKTDTAQRISTSAIITMDYGMVIFNSAIEALVGIETTIFHRKVIIFVCKKICVVFFGT